MPELLDAVERGESMVIMRRGRVIARLVPESLCSESYAAPQQTSPRWCERPHRVASGVGGTSEAGLCGCRYCKSMPYTSQRSG